MTRTPPARGSSSGAAVLPAALLAVLLGSCTSPSPGELSPLGCSSAGDVHLDGGSCLVFTDGGALDAYRPDVERVIAGTVATVRSRIPIDGVEIRVAEGTALVIPEIGMGGRASNGRRVEIMLDIDSAALPAALPDQLSALVAHELHHIARMRSIGYGSTLLAAMISEGLADRFSIEVAEIDPPPWSVRLSDEELETWTSAAKGQWLDGGYDHSAWFFGAGGTIPRWTGYSIGFALTGIYLAERPGVSAAELYDEPPVSFLP